MAADAAVVAAAAVLVAAVWTVWAVVSAAAAVVEATGAAVVDANRRPMSLREVARNEGLSMLAGCVFLGCCG